MCGLVGIAGDLAYKDEATMKRLLIFDYFRGPDSTGMAAIRRNGETKLSKCPSNPIDLFDHTSFKDALNGNQSIAFIGHNRSATRGAVNTVNAHPFQYDHITGAHNGTLDYQSVNELEESLGEKFSCDSMAIFASIAKNGVDDTLKMMREGRDYQTGAWSLVWFDRKENTLNFLRNKHRPMWYAFDKDFKRLFWASEWAIIDAAVKLNTHGTDLYTNDKFHRFWSTETDMHYRFDLEALKKGGKDQPKPKVHHLQGKEPAQAAGTSYDPFNRREGYLDLLGQTGKVTDLRSSILGKGGSSTASTSKGSDKDKPKTEITLLGTGDNPFAGVITKEQFEVLAQYGCSYCSRSIEWGDVGCTVFERDDILLCACCSKGDKNQTRVHVPNLDDYR